jgi:CHAT domain
MRPFHGVAMAIHKQTAADTTQDHRWTSYARIRPRDLGMAHELHAALIGPVEALVKDKRHLLVVPSGPLTALPFHLLVTERPAVAVPQVKSLHDLAAYRDASWLLKRHAVTVLPSVASLKALAFSRPAFLVLQELSAPQNVRNSF